MIGETILHYRILEKIGEGGMGVVYKALDTHLDRLVAIKVLPPDRVQDADRRQRFVQEAKAASALHHPNIIVVHDIAVDRGLDFIVMEHVDGSTLDRLIGRKGLNLNEALGYAVQIADGLAKAHAAGIVHRDLKPTNVMITSEGQAKILDFGLAKLMDAGEADALGPTRTLDRVDKPRTEAGYVVGTAAYMSPEQAEGKKVDARTDIFSFGALLYEMLTGQKAFSRETRMSTLAAILREEPKAAGQVNDALPPDIEPILARCLRKDPQRRWQSMSDLKVVLLDLKEDSESGKLHALVPAARPRSKKWMPAAAVGLFILAASAVLVWLLFLKPKPPLEYDQIRLTFDSGVTMQPTIFPDGSMLAFVSDRAGAGDLDIWVRQASGENPLRLTTNPADDGAPSFSPDGTKIVFVSERDGGGIYLIDALNSEAQGGQARRIADRGAFPKYSPDGSSIVFIDIPASLDVELTKLFLVSPKGGAPVPFQPEFCVSTTLSGPVWSPDGKQILFLGRRIKEPATLDWWLAPVDGRSPVRTGALNDLSLPPVWRFPCAWSGPYVYYVSGGSTMEGINIYRVRIESDRWKISGIPERVTAGAGMNYEAAVARDGRVFYHNLSALMNVWGLAADPDQGTVSGEPIKLTEDQTAKFTPDISRDGSRLVYGSFSGQQSVRTAVRLRDMATGKERSIPAGGNTNVLETQISPDGSVLSYRDLVSGKFMTFVAPTDSLAARQVCESCRILDFYSDSKFALVFAENQLIRLDLSSGKRIPVLVPSTGTILGASLSPDDRRVALLFGRPEGRAAIYLVPIGGQAVSEKDGVLVIEDNRYLGSPKFSPNGNLLYFLSNRDGHCCLWSQRLDPISKKPVGESFAVHHFHNPHLNLNLPAGNGTLGIAKDRIIFFGDEAAGNIWVAKPKAR